MFVVVLKYGEIKKIEIICQKKMNDALFFGFLFEETRYLLMLLL